MKVTVKFDEAAGMLPSEVKVKQVRDGQWAQCERARRDAANERYLKAHSEWRAVAVEAALKAAKDGGVK